MNKLFSLFVVFLSLLSITSCEKDDSSKPIYLNVNGPDGKPAATSITITEGAELATPNNLPCSPTENGISKNPQPTLG